MTHLKIALLQMTAAETDQHTNMLKAEAFCRQAHQAGAEIALMPELFNIGYRSIPDDTQTTKQVWQAQAITRDSEFVTRFQLLAQQLQMAIAVTYLEQWQNAPRNSVSLFDRFGKEVFTYAKVHTCDFSLMESACTPGDDFFVSTLDTAVGEVRVGMMICYDREHPESARILMLKGAEVVLTPNACHLDDLRVGQFRARAFENASAMFMCNYAKPDQNGQSVAFDEEAKLLVHAGEEEGVFVASLDLEKLRAYRQSTIWGNAYRRPHRYQLLGDCQKEPVFERCNAYKAPFVCTER